MMMDRGVERSNVSIWRETLDVTAGMMLVIHGIMSSKFERNAENDENEMRSREEVIVVEWKRTEDNTAKVKALNIEKKLGTNIYSVPPRGERRGVLAAWLLVVPSPALSLSWSRMFLSLLSHSFSTTGAFRSSPRVFHSSYFGP